MGLANVGAYCCRYMAKNDGLGLKCHPKVPI